MAKLGEGLRNVAGALADSVGITGFREGWRFARKDYNGPLSRPVAAGAGTLLAVEEIFGPNSIRDAIIEDNVSTTSEYYKGNSFYASMFLDGLSFAGAVGVGLLANSFEAALATKVGLNAGTSFAVRTYDSIQRRSTQKASA